MSVVSRIVGVFLVLFIYEFGGTIAPFLGGIAVFNQYCEEDEDNIMCFFG